jgi:hypothetical protein
VSWFSDKHGSKASVRMAAPLARADGLVVEDFGDEVLVYDQTTDQAHCLTREAAMVWRVCDGRTSTSELATALALTTDKIAAAVEQLDAAGLLEAGPVSGMTRREATVRMAKVGGAAAAAPLIYSIMAPTPALAASQAFCLALGACSTSVNGCDACYKAGCVCCGEGTSGSTKLCTADCSPANCNPCIVHDHCGGSGTASSCTCGSSGVPGCSNVSKFTCLYTSPTTGLPCCSPGGICATSSCP